MRGQVEEEGWEAWHPVGSASALAPVGSPSPPSPLWSSLGFYLRNLGMG